MINYRIFVFFVIYLSVLDVYKSHFTESSTTEWMTSTLLSIGDELTTGPPLDEEEENEEIIPPEDDSTISSYITTDFPTTLTQVNDSGEEKSKKDIIIIALATIIGVVILAFGLVLCLFIKNRKAKNRAKTTTGLSGERLDTEDKRHRNLPVSETQNRRREDATVPGATDNDGYTKLVVQKNDPRRVEIKSSAETKPGNNVQLSDTGSPPHRPSTNPDLSPRNTKGQNKDTQNRRPLRNEGVSIMIVDNELYAASEEGHEYYEIK